MEDTQSLVETAPTRTVEVADGEQYKQIVETKVAALILQADEAAERITDIDTMNTAVSIGRTLRARIKEVDRTMDGIIEPARRAWKNALALHKRIREPMAERLKKLELAVGTYKTEVERRRKAEEEARLAEIRRRQEDEARRKLIHHGLLLFPVHHCEYEP